MVVIYTLLDKVMERQMVYRNNIDNGRYYPGVPDDMQEMVGNIINGFIALAARAASGNMDSNLLRLFARLRLDKVSACLC